MPTDVLKDELSKLTLSSKAVQTAIRSYQELMGEDFDRLSMEIHDRPGIADGVYGPATIQLLGMKRCGCPDYGPEVELATGRGSWPAGCWEEYPDHHAFAIHWDKRNMPSYLVGVIDQCIERCYAAYRNIGIAFFTSPDRNRCNTRVTFERGQGWIGLAIVGQNQVCRDRIWAKFDTRYKPSRLVDQWSRLLAHEFGHNMGLRHSRGGIMNPSISQGAFTKTAWRGDPSESILTRWFGGEPVPPRDKPDPDPDPKPPADKIVIRGELEIEIDGESGGTFVMTPKPEV